MFVTGSPLERATRWAACHTPPRLPYYRTSNWANYVLDQHFRWCLKHASHCHRQYGCPPRAYAAEASMFYNGKTGRNLQSSMASSMRSQGTSAELLAGEPHSYRKDPVLRWPYNNQALWRASGGLMRSVQHFYNRSVDKSPRSKALRVGLHRRVLHPIFRHPATGTKI